MLKTNFVKNANSENGGKFYKAVAHISYQMEVKSCEEAIKKAQNQRDSDSATDAEKKVAEDAIKSLTKCRDEGNHISDAKSIMAIFSYDLTAPIKVGITTGYDPELQKFKKEMEKYKWEK